MPRETQTEKNNNPAYYETISCEDCGGIEHLRMHASAKDIICVDCLNKVLARASEEKEREHEEIFGREGYYTDMSYNELLQERNA